MERVKDSTLESEVRRVDPFDGADNKCCVPFHGADNKCCVIQVKLDLIKILE